MDTINYHSRLLISAALAGVLVQLITNRIREVQTVPFLSFYAIGLAVAVALIHRQLDSSLAVASTVLQINAVFLAALISLTIVRRVFFHPLCSFPGKKLAAVSGLYQAYLNSEGRLGHELRALHRVHGDIVRIAPNEVSCIAVDALSPLFGKGLPHTTRGPFYDISRMIGATNLLTERDSKKHAVLKRIWDPAMKPAVIRSYDPVVEKHVAALVEALQRGAGGDVETVRLATNMTFDM